MEFENILEKIINFTSGEENSVWFTDSGEINIIQKAVDRIYQENLQDERPIIGSINQLFYYLQCQTNQAECFENLEEANKIIQEVPILDAGCNFHKLKDNRNYCADAR